MVVIIDESINSVMRKFITIGCLLKSNQITLLCAGLLYLIYFSSRVLFLEVILFLCIFENFLETFNLIKKHRNLFFFQAVRKQNKLYFKYFAISMLYTPFWWNCFYINIYIVEMIEINLVSTMTEEASLVLVVTKNYWC